jgi:hypothetical protein
MAGRKAGSPTKSSIQRLQRLAGVCGFSEDLDIGG